MDPCTVTLLLCKLTSLLLFLYLFKTESLPQLDRKPFVLCEQYFPFRKTVMQLDSSRAITEQASWPSSSDTP